MSTYYMYEVHVIGGHSHGNSGLPRSGKNIWKMNFFPGQGKVREFCEWPGKRRKRLGKSGKSQGI